LWGISFALLAVEEVLADQQPVGWVEARNKVGLPGFENLAGLWPGNYLETNL
jgi:hypothetical protein